MNHRIKMNSTLGTRTWAVWILVMLSVLALTAYPALPVYAEEEYEQDIKIGKEAAAQVAKESKFIEDPEIVQRVETIGKAIAKVATEKEVKATYGKSTPIPFEYSFKVVDDKDINAFALPGGFVYINKGLIDSVHSDDELAAVIAHEVAHVSHRHAMHMIKSQQKQMLGVMGAVIVSAILGADGKDMATVIDWASIISMAKMSSYGQLAEFDADRTAVAYLAESGYNAVGMLTFMERLAQEDLRKPQINYGIFATHPPSDKRAKEIIDELTKRGIRVNRRLVTQYMRVEVKPVEGSDASAIWIAGTEIVRLADSGGERAVSRAEKVAGRMNNLLLGGAGLHDVKIGGGNQYVVMVDRVVIAPTAEDAALAGTTVPELTTSAANAIKRALLLERLGQSF